jgi:hypothetical protein
VRVDAPVRLRQSRWWLLPPYSTWQQGSPTWRWTRGLLFLVPLGQIAVLLWMIWTRTATVPYWDEWDSVPIVQHFQQGTLTWRELWSVHAAAHRILLPRLLDLTLIELTHWNRQIEMTFDLAVACAALLLLIVSMARTVKTAMARFVLLVPFSLLAFSFAEFENWFAPFQIAFIATMFGAACCVWGLHGQPVGWRRFAVALAGATAAVASSLPGLLLWLAFLPSVLKLDRRKVAVWCACGLAQWIVYLIGFQHSPTTVHVFQDLIFALVYLGAPAGFPFPFVDAAAGLWSVGLFAAVVVVQWRRHRTLRHVDVWICLAIFVLACEQVTALGRTIGFSLSSRYLAFSGMWWMALFVMWAATLEDSSGVGKGVPRDTGRPRRGLVFRRACVAVLMLASLGLVEANAVGLGMGLQWVAVQQANQESVIQFASAPDSCLRLYTFSPALLRQGAAFLARNHMAIFSGSAAVVRSAAPACTR